MAKIAFTICSNNYLAQAKTLGDSIQKTNSDYQFFIGLTDKLIAEIDYQEEIVHSIIPCEEIGIPDFDTLWKKYSIIEFNTCLKPFYFKYFGERFPDLEYIFYLDPDTVLYGNMSEIEKEFGMGGRVLVTPHILTPISIDDKMPNESQFLIYGIYNLGFLGLKNPQQSIGFLDWWKERTYHLGYNKTSEGLFVDQLWLNLVPIFFKDVIVSKHPGLNMAPWNLHERSLSFVNSRYYVNNVSPLIFYHFSNYKYSNPNSICINYDRYNFETRSDLILIYKTYNNLLLKNGIQKLCLIKCQYMAMRERHLIDERKKSTRGTIKYYLKKVFPKKIIKILHAIII